MWHMKNRARTNIILLLLLSLLIVCSTGQHMTDYGEKTASDEYYTYYSDRLTVPVLPQNTEIERLTSIIHIQSLPVKRLDRSDSILLFRIILFTALACLTYLSIFRISYYSYADQSARAIIDYIHNQEDHK